METSSQGFLSILGLASLRRTAKCVQVVFHTTRHEGVLQPHRKTFGESQDHLLPHDSRTLVSRIRPADIDWLKTRLNTELASPRCSSGLSMAY
jgi:hypothetical protein